MRPPELVALRLTSRPREASGRCSRPARGARHSGAESALDRLPEAHFAVSSEVVREIGREGRSLERWKAMLREATTALEDLQNAGTKRLAAVLSSGLR